MRVGRIVFLQRGRVYEKKDFQCFSNIGFTVPRSGGTGSYTKGKSCRNGNKEFSKTTSKLHR